MWTSFKKPLGLHADKLAVDIHVEDPDGMPDDAVTLIEVVSDGGRVVARRATNAAAVDWTTTVESGAARYFYVRVTTASDVTDGEGVTAWTAPVWTNR